MTLEEQIKAATEKCQAVADRWWEEQEEAMLDNGREFEYDDPDGYEDGEDLLVDFDRAIANVGLNPDTEYRVKARLVVEVVPQELDDWDVQPEDFECPIGPCEDCELTDQ